MNKDTIVGAGRAKFIKPGEKYHWVRETSWERGLEAAGLLPKRWAVAKEPVVVDTYDGGKEWIFIDRYKLSPEEDKAWQDSIDADAKSVDPLNAVVVDWCTVEEFMDLVDKAQKAIKAGTNEMP